MAKPSFDRHLDLFLEMVHDALHTRSLIDLESEFFSSFSSKDFPPLFEMSKLISLTGKSQNFYLFENFLVSKALLDDVETKWKQYCEKKGELGELEMEPQVLEEASQVADLTHKKTNRKKFGNLNSNIRKSSNSSMKIIDAKKPNSYLKNRDKEVNQFFIQSFYLIKH